MHHTSVSNVNEGFYRHYAGGETRTQEVNCQRLTSKSVASGDDNLLDCWSYGKYHRAAFLYNLCANVSFVAGSLEVIWKLNSSLTL